MSNLFNIFSTREIALFIWFLIFVIFVSRTKEVRLSIVCVIKAFLDKKLVIAFSTMLIYILLVILILSYIRFWDMSLLKDTIVWILFSGIILFMNTNKVDNIDYFSKLIKDNIKIIVIFEFLFNLYTLSLFGELILIPIVSFFSIVGVFAEHSSKQEESYKNVAVLCKNILGLIGLSMIGYVIYKTITEYNLLLSVSNLKFFLLPILLAILILPYFYFLALYINYESFISMVKHLHRKSEPTIIKDLIKATFKYANFNINKIKRIWKYQSSFDLSKENPNEFIKRVSKTPKYYISNKAKLILFNDIRKVIEDLSNIGIGKLDEWHKSYAGDDYYLSITNYYQFGIDDITKIPNTLAFYLTGKETYIKQLDVILDIGYEQDKHLALDKFIEILHMVFNSLSVPLPNDLVNSITISKKYSEEYNTHILLLDYEIFEKIESYTLSIITK